MTLELAQSTLPLEDFLADRPTGLHLVERLTQMLVDRQRVLIWGPRVGAIELAEDLFTLWPASANQIVALNLGALWSRTRADGQDSGWADWVDTTPAQLIEHVLARQPEGVVLTFASPLAQELLPRLVAGPFGFVTALAASSAQEALERARPLFGEALDRFDWLVGVTESGASTWISEVARLEKGSSVPTTRLANGHYVRA